MFEVFLVMDMRCVKIFELVYLDSIFIRVLEYFVCNKIIIVCFNLFFICVKNYLGVMKRVFYLSWLKNGLDIILMNNVIKFCNFMEFFFWFCLSWKYDCKKRKKLMLDLERISRFC